MNHTSIPVEFGSEKRLPNVYTLFWCYENLDYKGIAGDSTFAGISKKRSALFPLLARPEPVLAAFEHLVLSVYKRIVENEKESKSLADNPATCFYRSSCPAKSALPRLN